MDMGHNCGPGVAYGVMDIHCMSLLPGGCRASVG